MEIPTQEQILAAVKPGAVPQQPPADVPEEAVVEEEVVESEVAETDIIDTESVETADSDDEPEDVGTDEDDDEVYLEYTLNGEKLKVNLASEEDLIKVKTALEKQGLEVTAQRHAESAKEAGRRADAAEIKLRELEAMKEAEAPLEPWRKAIENPQFRDAVARQNPRANLPQVNFNPEVAKVAADNARLLRQNRMAEDQQAVVEANAQSISAYGLSEGDMNKCCDYLGENGYKWGDGPYKGQVGNMVKLVGMARDALIGQGKLPNPEVLKAQAETEKVTKKLKATKKRRAARSASPGTGAIPATAGNPPAELRGASIDTLVAEYKKRSGK